MKLRFAIRDLITRLSRPRFSLRLIFLVVVLLGTVFATARVSYDLRKSAAADDLVHQISILEDNVEKTGDPISMREAEALRKKLHKLAPDRYIWDPIYK